MKNRKCDRRYAGTVCTCGHVIGSHAAGAAGSTAGGTCLHRYCSCQRYRALCAVCKQRPAAWPPYGFATATAPTCDGCAAMFKGVQNA